MSDFAVLASVRRLRRLLAAQHGQEERDEQLLDAFANRHDETAFAALVHRHGPMVLGVCRRVLGCVQDAEDAYQATFLVLARRAAALRDKTALASFLHGTAYHLSSKIKRAAGRRRKHEACAPARPAVNPADELLWREVRALLDEEIARLPEKYRNVFVLCCLENVSQAETGRRLGLKERTVSNRLGEARKRLQQRLSRRGVELTALVAAATLTTETASALPAGLLSKAIGGAVSPAVAALADSIPSLFGVGKIKLVMAIVLAVSVLSGAAWWAYRRPASSPAQSVEPPAAKATDKPKAVPPQRQTAKTVEIQGRVLGPDGQPKAGVKLLLLGEEKITALGVSAADGRFTVSVPKQTKGYLIARPSDAGMDFIALSQLQHGKPVEFHLVKDHVIRGRIVNTEGKPIRGARVAVTGISIYPDNSLDSFLVAWKNQPLQMPRGVKDLRSKTAALCATTTDADGCFAVHSAGVERFLWLHVSGAGIADSQLWVANRDGLDPKPYNQARLDNIPKGWEHFGSRRVLFGPDVSVVVEAEKIIRGVVKDADTGKGQPGVVVHLTRYGDDPPSLFLSVRATTDAGGRYEIHGARKAKSYMLEVAGDQSTGYMASQVLADDTSDYRPVAANIRVKKGTIVTGRVIDQATGKAVPGIVIVGVLADNPFVKEYPKFDASAMDPVRYTSDDGSFRIVTIPGPVLLMGRPISPGLPGGVPEWLKYKPAVPDPKYPRYFTKPRDFQEYFCPGGSAPVDYNFCKVLQIKPGATVVEQDIVLERASDLAVTIQDAEGRPLSGVWVMGISPEYWRPPLRIEDHSCSAYHVEAGKPRLMIFYEPGRKLAGTRTLKGDEKPPVVVKLGPAGSAKGRLLDADGNPLTGIEIDVHYRNREAREVHTVIYKGKQIVTDTAGAFTLDELIPELKFQLSVRRGRQRFERQTKPAEATMQVKAGECRDLGAIKLKLLPEKAGE